MEIRTKYCLTLLTIAALCEVSLTADKPSTKTDPEMTLNRVLDAIDRALDFFMVEHERVNLDAIIGTRMVEGKLHSSLIRSLHLHTIWVVSNCLSGCRSISLSLSLSLSVCLSLLGQKGNYPK